MFFFEKKNVREFYDFHSIFALYEVYKSIEETEIVSNIFYCTYINENIYMVDCSLSKQ